jgi:hypothetical protein
MGTTKDLSKSGLYDYLCSQLDKFSQGLNICDWHDDIHGKACLRAYDICCHSGGTCSHLNNSGCTVQSLSCKLWLCSLALANLTRLALGSGSLANKAATYLRVRDKVADLCRHWYLPIKSRCSKEETFDSSFTEEYCIDQSFDWINQEFPLPENADLDSYVLEAVCDLISTSPLLLD